MKHFNRLAPTIVAISALLAGCVVPESIRQHEEFIQNEVLSNPDVKEAWLENDGFQLYYRFTGTANKATVIWVHGTPGSWEDVGQLLLEDEFNQQALLATIDRPGWGKSQFIDQPRLVTSYQEQAKLIHPLLENLKNQYPDKPLILAGPFAGRSIIPVIALEFPQLVDGLLILAAGLDPELTGPTLVQQAGQ